MCFLPLQALSWPWPSASPDRARESPISTQPTPRARQPHRVVCCSVPEGCLPLAVPLISWGCICLSNFRSFPPAVPPAPSWRWGWGLDLQTLVGLVLTGISFMQLSGLWGPACLWGASQSSITPPPPRQAVPSASLTVTPAWSSRSPYSPDLKAPGKDPLHPASGAASGHPVGTFSGGSVSHTQPHILRRVSCMHAPLVRPWRTPVTAASPATHWACFGAGRWPRKGHGATQAGAQASFAHQLSIVDTSCALDP